ncbi:MAG: DNA helicase RecQ [Lachnospiraceae bacterium]|nr:DNA helicase RecQ [Lachnospiraceae bacterium]
MNTPKEKYEILKTYYGYDSFRDGQEELIDCLLSNRDVCGIMPTGAGKSVCYQVPALILPGITLVISPLISLMKDQVRALNQMGVHAAYLNSSLTYHQYLKALALAKECRYKIIYVAPERLLTEDFLDFAVHAPISMLAVDEAHCVSQWGQDFRPSYLKIPDFVQQLPTRPVIGAFTATATREVKEDIIRMLNLSDPHMTVTGFDRKNLYFEVRHDKDKYGGILQYLNAHPDSSGIIYCATRKNVEEVCDRLISDGFAATRYHAGLSDAERRSNQEAFTYDETPIMVATNAFGMGIDKSNVRFVLHYNMPKNMESYYQEAGRAGRDGAAADCILFYSGQDVITNQFFIEQNRDNEELTGEALELVRQRDRERLKKMTFYCHTPDCLRDYMLRYFGEYGAGYCGNCSNCLHTFETVDITQIANDMIGCVLTSGMRYGVNVILDALRGSKSEKVLRFQLNENHYYGSQANETIVFLRQVLNYLVLTEYLVVTDDQYPIVKVKEKGLSFFSEAGDFRPVLTMKAARKTTQTPSKGDKASAYGTFSGETSASSGSKKHASAPRTGSAPFESLRKLRTEIARAQHIPPYLVFSDKTLESMCVLLPQTKEEMLTVHGVGELKYQKYGEQFLKLCQELAGDPEI